MTEAEKQLLLKDLCARLPYNVKIQFIVIKDGSKIIGEIESIEQGGDISFSYWSEYEQKWKIMNSWIGEDYIKPYLRPMSSMMEEEKKEWNKVIVKSQDCSWCCTQIAICKMQKKPMQIP